MPQSGKSPRIFLCHASEDKPRVMELYRQLKEAGYHPWMDKFDLLPGQNWRREIEKVIRDPYNLILVCLSNNSVTKRGVVQQEMKWALDILEQMPEETIYLIPVRLEVCQAPDQLLGLHWVDLFEPDGFEYLIRALDYEINKYQSISKSKSITPTRIQGFRELEVRSILVKPPNILSSRIPFDPELILIPAGEFLMGSDPKKDKHTSNYEQPQHRLYLPNYYIAKTPVTNAQYMAFVHATGHSSPKHWNGKKMPLENEDHPVVYILWNDARAYCRWLTRVTGKVYRLPTEAEWEKAARGTDGRIYPWGNEWDAQRCNTREGGKRRTTSVGAYPIGASPYKVLDMAGNVWEWCATKWGKSYPYNTAEDEWSEDYLKTHGDRVLRGGSFGNHQFSTRCASRNWYAPDDGNGYNGFRVVASFE